MTSKTQEQSSATSSEKNETKIETPTAALKDLDSINNHLQRLTNEERKAFYKKNSKALIDVIYNTRETETHSAKLHQFLTFFDQNKKIYFNLFIIKKLQYHTFQDYHNLVNGLANESYQTTINYLSGTIINIYNNKTECKLLLDSFTSVDPIKKQKFIDFYIQNHILDLKPFENIDDILTIFNFLASPASCLDLYELKKDSILDVITAKIDSNIFNRIEAFLKHFNSDKWETIRADIRNALILKYVSAPLAPQVLATIDTYTLIQLLPIESRLNFHEQNKLANNFASYQAITDNLTNKQYESILSKFQLVDNILKNKQESELLLKDLSKGPITRASIFLKQYKNQFTTNHLEILLKLNFNKFFEPLKEIYINKITGIYDYFNSCATLCLTKSYAQTRNKLFDLLLEKKKFIEWIKTPTDFLQFNPAERDNLFYLFRQEYKFNQFIRNLDEFFIIFATLNSVQQEDLFLTFRCKLFDKLLPKQIEDCLTHFKGHETILKQFQGITESYVTTFKENYIKERSKLLFFTPNFVEELDGRKLNQQFFMIRKHAKKDKCRTQTVVNKMENQPFITTFKFS